MKEINEKTFELNITSQLLNVSKHLFWYLNSSPLSQFFTTDYCKKFLLENVFFAEGLTQKEESSKDGGYDVSINFNKPNQLGDNRLFFLQYKSGSHRNYSKNPHSIFFRSKVSTKDTNHIEFRFNEAANKTQHSTLRGLARKVGIQSESVLYVFPRITSKCDFQDKIESLLWHTSFVPVCEIDNQASLQNPPIYINDGMIHKYRTSYDGCKSEVNLLLFPFFYNQHFLLEILEEFICVQIERFALLFREYNRLLHIDFVGAIRVAFNNFLNDVLLGNSGYYMSITEYPEYKKSYITGVSNLQSRVDEYLFLFSQENSRLSNIPKAPERFTNVIPQQGLNLFFEKEITGSINYQIF